MIKIINRRTTLVSPNLALLSIVGLWVFYTLIYTLRSIVMAFPDQLELTKRRLVVAFIGIVITWLYSMALTRFDNRSLAEKITAAATIAIPAAIAISVFNHLIFNSFESVGLFDDIPIERQFNRLRNDAGIPIWQDVIELSIILYFFIIAWASLYLTLGYAREVREAERTASRYAQAAQDAELRSLRYQVNPHFLFNTLNSLSSLVIKGDNARAEEMIQSLSGFYRTSLSSDPLEDVTLIEEVELQQRYLEIEAVRYPERLRVVIDIPAEVQNTKVPGMILQPLVENAIKYGVARTNRPVTVKISAKRIGNAVQINVTDDGDTLTTNGRNTDGNGIGLVNVRDRIEARYGERGHLFAGAQGKGGFAATITIADEDFA